MSERVREVARCEHCGVDIELESPPLRKYYEQGRIDIKEGTVLLDRPPSSSSHASEIGGHYCNLTCFVNYIVALRDGNIKRVSRCVK